MFLLPWLSAREVSDAVDACLEDAADDAKSSPVTAATSHTRTVQSTPPESSTHAAAADDDAPPPAPPPNPPAAVLVASTSAVTAPWCPDSHAARALAPVV
jgi:hypothetical protein